MSSEQYLLKAVLTAEFNSVNAGYNGSTGMQVAASGELKATRRALADFLGLNPNCDLFNAVLAAGRITEQEKRIGKLCYAP